MTQASILLDTKTLDLMESLPRKEQTYRDFILELNEHKRNCTIDNVKMTNNRFNDKKLVGSNLYTCKSKDCDSTASVKEGT
jgi:hypothetical protein